MLSVDVFEVKFPALACIILVFTTFILGHVVCCNELGNYEKKDKELLFQLLIVT